jgi:hypothetical protein
VGCERWDAQKALAESSAPAVAKLGKPKPKIPPCNKDFKGTAHRLHKERLRKERLRFYSKENKNPKKSYGRNLRWKSCITEFMSRVFGLTSFLHQLKASSPCRKNDCS